MSPAILNQLLEKNCTAVGTIVRRGLETEIDAGMTVDVRCGGNGRRGA
jgi:hypothetical protein